MTSSRPPAPAVPVVDSVDSIDRIDYQDSSPAAPGIPVTHRGITTSVVIVSAHADAGQALDAARTAPRDATLVLLMGWPAPPRT